LTTTTAPRTRQQTWRLRRPQVQAAIWFLIAVLMLIPTLFPALWIILSSVKTSAETHTFPPTFLASEFSLEAYRAVFGRGNFLHYMFNALVVALATTALGVLVAAWSGYGFARYNFRGKGLALAFIIAAQSFPRVLLIIPYFQAMTALRLTDTYVALILAYSTFIQPLCLWMLKSYIEQIPRELDEAALLDGCSHYGVFWRVIVPTIRPALGATAMLAFLTAWNEYEFALVLTSSERVRTISVAVAYFLGEFTTEWNNIMAASAVATIPVIIVFFFFQKQLVSGLTGGALKG
jgi:multiple sugar transport system permease protein